LQYRKTIGGGYEEISFEKTTAPEVIQLERRGDVSSSCPPQNLVSAFVEVSTGKYAVKKPGFCRALCLLHTTQNSWKVAQVRKCSE